jgi:hypothetical protein
LIIAIIIFLLVVTCGVLIYQLSRKIKLDNETRQKNEQLKKDIIDLEIKLTGLKANKNALDAICNSLTKQKKHTYEELTRLEDSLNKLTSQSEKIAVDAYTNYVEGLEKAYSEAEHNFDANMSSLKHDILELNQELDKLKATRAAAHEALLKEQEVKDNKDNYRLLPSQSDLNDARRLEVVKRELNKPRILSMLIWQTYWQPLAKKQFPLILQNKTKCGIYKITNLITDDSYIGQSVDIYKRWCDHCKCGLGIDTPPGNKLYKAIQEYGLENFTFELLVECTQAELNDKERYFIELYQADTFGYNGNKGIC